VAASARQWLAPGGRLLIETSRQQAPQTLQLFELGGLSARLVHSAELDGTVVIGT
jgi:release factor glutamine methyltransferase